MFLGGSMSAIKAMVLKYSLVGLCIMTFFSYQNCGKVQFAPSAVEELASKSNVNTPVTYACTEAVACEKDGQVGTMSCVNGVLGDCQIENLPGPTTTTTTVKNQPQPQPQSCVLKLNDREDVQLNSNASYTAYFSAQVPAGEKCNSQLRVCMNGSVSGSAKFSKCVEQSGDCSVNGQVIKNGDSIKTYNAAQVSYGQSCQEKDVICKNGQLSEGFAYYSCQVQDPKNCSVNGSTIQHGKSLSFFSASQVAYGQRCESKQIECVNGSFNGGNYKYSACQVASPADCSFNGKAIKHGDTVVGYSAQTVAYNQSCDTAKKQMTCEDGKLLGSDVFKNSTCTVASPLNCSLAGITVNHGSRYTFYSSSEVPYAQTCSGQVRQCTNGVLGGSDNYKFTSCKVLEAKSCNYNNQVLASGQSIIGYSKASVKYNQSCNLYQGKISCNNGNLSGQNAYPYPGCQVESPKDCDGVKHGQSKEFFKQALVAYGKSCEKQARQCVDGVLGGSGEYSQASCHVDSPKSCLFYGQTVAHNSSVTSFKVASVPYGSADQCGQNQIASKCNNGEFSPALGFKDCGQQEPKKCSFNGKTYNMGEKIYPAKLSEVTAPAQCETTERVCNGVTGEFDGDRSFSYASCVQKPQPEVVPGLYTVMGNGPISSGVSTATCKPGDKVYACETIVGQGGDPRSHHIKAPLAVIGNSSNQCVSEYSSDGKDRKTVMAVCGPDRGQDVIMTGWSYGSVTATCPAGKVLYSCVNNVRSSDSASEHTQRNFSYTETSCTSNSYDGNDSQQLMIICGQPITGKATQVSSVTSHGSVSATCPEKTALVSCQNRTSSSDRESWHHLNRNFNYDFQNRTCSHGTYDGKDTQKLTAICR